MLGIIFRYLFGWPVTPSGVLPVSAGQAGVINNDGNYLEQALLYGTTDGFSTILPNLPLYSTVDTSLHPSIRNPFESQLAASIKALLLDTSFGNVVPVTVIITLAKLTPGGTTGSLTFFNGICTAAVQPT